MKSKSFYTAQLIVMKFPGGDDNGGSGGSGSGGSGGGQGEGGNGG